MYETLPFPPLLNEKNPQMHIQTTNCKPPQTKSLLPEEDKPFLLPDKHHRGVRVIYTMKETHLLLFNSAHIDL